MTTRACKAGPTNHWNRAMTHHLVRDDAQGVEGSPLLGRSAWGPAVSTSGHQDLRSALMLDPFRGVDLAIVAGGTAFACLTARVNWDAFRSFMPADGGCTNARAASRGLTRRVELSPAGPVGATALHQPPRLHGARAPEVGAWAASRRRSRTRSGDRGRGPCVRPPSWQTGRSRAHIVLGPGCSRVSAEAVVTSYPAHGELTSWEAV